MSLAQTEEEIYTIEKKNLNHDSYIARPFHNPGPGYYIKDKEIIKTQNKMNQSSRFKESKDNASCAPGEYSTTVFNSFYHTS